MNLAVFDLDGTLTKHFAEDEESFVHAFLHAFNIDDVNRRWLDYEHHTDLCVVREVFRTTRGRQPTSAELSCYIDAYLTLLARAAQRRLGMVAEIGGAGSLLETFTAGILWRSAIATGGWEGSARFKLAAAGFSIDAIPSAFAEDGPSRERIVQTAIERANMQHGQERFEKVVLLGDGVWDVRTAHRLGLPVIGIADGMQGDLLVRAGARYVLDNFRDDSHL